MPRPLLLLLLAVSVLASVATPTVAAGEPADPNNTRSGKAAEPEPPVLVVLDEARHAPDVARAAGVEHRSGTAGVTTRPPSMIVRATRAEQARLRADARVRGVLPRGQTVGLALAQSVPLLGAPGRWAAGTTGAGATTAVIDTGVTTGFGGSVVGQACFAGLSTGGNGGHCGPNRNVDRAFDRACFDAGVCDPATEVQDPLAGRPCGQSSSPSLDCQHGSAVAAVAGRSQTPRGVAPGSGVYPVQVFDPTGESADLVDIYLAAAHVAALHDAGGFEFSSANMSVATNDTFAVPCDNDPALGGATDAFLAVFDALRARGIAPVVAAGNNGVSGRLSFPGCLSNAIAIGATDQSDIVAPFSNRVPGTLMAPGTDSSLSFNPLDIPSGPGYSTQWAGTSFAAPHVAGAFALLEGDLPLATVDHREWFLRRAGANATDGVRRYRRAGVDAPGRVLPGGVFLPAKTTKVAAGAEVSIADFDGDGRDDVLAYGPGSAPDAVSYGRGDRWDLDTVAFQIGGDHQVLTGQFRGSRSGPEDVLFYTAGPGSDALWSGRTNRSFGVSGVSIHGTYEPHIGDFDGDGWDDVFWYAPGPAPDHIWHGGSTGFASRAAPVGGTYRVAIGDFDRDGRDDIFFHRPGRLADWFWFSRSTRGAFDNRRLSISGSYLPIVMDSNGDSASDMLLYAAGSAPDFLWVGPAMKTSNSGVSFNQTKMRISGTYDPFVGDFNADGKDDVGWHNQTAARDHFWMSRPGGAWRSRAVAMPTGSQARVGNVDGRGGPEVLFTSDGGQPTAVWWNRT